MSTLILAFAALFVFGQGKDAIVGKWLNASGEGQIQITKRGDKFFGKLVYLKFPNDDAGKPKVDTKNPDESLRKRPLLNLEILKNFVYEGDQEYEDGTIYDPKSGKTYSCKMTLDGNNKLKVRGYVGISLIGRTEVWTRIK